MNSKGFTLLELLIVFIIISVLAAIAIPMFASHIDYSRRAVVKSTLAEGYRVAQWCFCDGVKSLDEWKSMEEHGMHVSSDVRIWIVDGHRTIDTLLIYAQHKKDSTIRYQVDSEGHITRRAP